MFLEICLGILSSLANPVILVGVPGPTFVDETPLAHHIHEVALAIHHVKLCLPERRRHVIFRHLHPHAAGRWSRITSRDSMDVIEQQENRLLNSS